MTTLQERQAELTRRRAVQQTELQFLAEDVTVLKERIISTRRTQGAAKQEIPSAEEDARALNERLLAQAVKSAEIRADTAELMRISDRISRDLKWRNSVMLFNLVFGMVFLLVWLVRVQLYQDRLLRAQAEMAEVSLRKARAEQAGGAPAGGDAPPETTRGK